MNGCSYNVYNIHIAPTDQLFRSIYRSNRIFYALTVVGPRGRCSNSSLLSHKKILLVVVVSMFYGPSTLFRTFRARSVTVNLSTLFLGKPPRLGALSFASNRQLPFLDSAEGREWP